MSTTYKRWLPPLRLVDGVAMAPAVLLATNHRKRDEKNQQQLELRSWEAEGGNPAPPAAVVQSTLSEGAPEVDTANPPNEKSTKR